MMATQELNQAAATYTELSRHNTSQGVVTYLRCNCCNALRMVALPARSGGATIAAGSHGDQCPCQTISAA